MHFIPASTLALSIALAGASAQAADDWSGQMDTPTQTSSPRQLNPDAIDDALVVPGLTRSQHAWLEPQRNRLPSNPRGQTDFTAYTLEWGETKLGLATITVGVLPRTHIGTVPVLDVLGIPNAHIKVNPIRLGRYDVALSANHYSLTRGDFSAYQTGMGFVQSLQISEPWSVHVGAHYAVIGSQGIPMPSTLPTPIQSDQVSDTDLTAAQAQLGTDDLSFRAEALSVHVATDIRFNRRDRHHPTPGPGDRRGHGDRRERQGAYRRDLCGERGLAVLLEAGRPSHRRWDLQCARCLAAPEHGLQLPLRWQDPAHRVSHEAHLAPQQVGHQALSLSLSW